jgi:hypothetical protein
MPRSSVTFLFILIIILLNPSCFLIGFLNLEMISNVS